MPVDDLFVNEDLNKPENRVNVAMFGLMQQDWFREWFLKKLGLQTDAVVYPPTNQSLRRPDLKVVGSDDSILAWVEVELGSNAAQAKDYARLYDEPIKTVWGRQADGGDLSLEDVAAYVDSQTNLPPQTKINAQLLSDLIREGLFGFSSSPGRASVSDEMRAHPFVKALSDRLGDRLLFDLGSKSPGIGYLKADTTGGPNNRGFSLRVRKKKSDTVSLLNIRGGAPEVRFPSTGHLEEHLPKLPSEVQAYAALLLDMGIDISGVGHHADSLPLDTVLGRIDELANCARALASHPRR